MSHNGFILPGLMHNRSRSTRPVRFRVVIDNEPLGSIKVISTDHDNIEVAKFDADIAIRKKEVSPDDTVVVQSSYTDKAGVTTWYDQHVAQRPRGKKFKAYCESAACEKCESCGQPLPVQVEEPPCD